MLQNEKHTLIEEKSVLVGSICMQNDQIKNYKLEIESLKDSLSEERAWNAKNAKISDREQQLSDLLMLKESDLANLHVKYDQIAKQVVDNNEVNDRHLKQIQFLENELQMLSEGNLIKQQDISRLNSILNSVQKNYQLLQVSYIM